MPKKNDSELLNLYQNNWSFFAEDVLGVKTLDYQQKEILEKIRLNKKTSVCSGNARGKDFLSAVAALCFLYLHQPSKVICTAPTQRQVFAIMLSEIGTIFDNTPVSLGGLKSKTKIKFPGSDNHFLIGFKAADKSKEAWQGFHSDNIFVIVSEASGISDELFENIDGILTGNSKLLIVFNPLQKKGESYRSLTDPRYYHTRLNSMDAPNVINYQKYLDGKISFNEFKQSKIPGQVDWQWVDDKVGKKGWSYPVFEKDVQEDDFLWKGKYYHPLDPFRIRVFGQYGDDPESQLIPLSWIERSHKMWKLHNSKSISGKKIIGVDVAGEGVDKTVFCRRRHNFVQSIRSMNFPKDNKIHMNICGKIIETQKNEPSYIMIDTTGEGAGIFSRLAEQEINNCFSCKGSFSAKGLTDFFELKEFVCMRDYLMWTIRDALDPKVGFNLMLPPNSELDEELTALEWKYTSNGKVKIINKIDLNKKLGHSPDFVDSLGLTFVPV